MTAAMGVTAGRGRIGLAFLSVALNILVLILVKILEACLAGPARPVEALERND